MTSQEMLPDHLIELPGETVGRWALWRTVAARGAGFPADGVLRIADAECAAAADRLIAAEAEAGGRLEAERESYRAAFDAADVRLGAALRETAQDDRFREAVVWQNRHAVETGLGAFLRRPPGRGIASQNHRHRKHAQLIASYLQRYCTKNDTVGFFGPVGWARWSGSGVAIAARPGRELLAARQVYFEGWAIDALADHLAQDPAMRPWLAPRLLPFLRREGRAYITAGGQKIELGPISSALIASCDGTQPARELIRRLGDLPLESQTILWNMLDNYHVNGLLNWGFQIPMSPNPERTLRELLEGIGDEMLRERGLALLGDLERGRDAVSRAAGKAEALERAMGELEATFRQATGKASTRAPGEVYGGRTLVYEECRRDLDLELGAPLLAELGPALSLVLASARWFTHHLGTVCRDLFDQAFTELASQAGSAAQIDLLAFSRVALPRVMSRPMHAALEAELQARWERVLSLPPGERRVAWRSEDLRPLVQREFAAPKPGWLKARYHSPDLLIAAPSLEAIRQGDYQIVLGEIHAAMNSIDRWVFFTQHPEPELLAAAMQSDLPEPTISPLNAKIWNMEKTSAILGMPVPSATGRTDFATSLDKDYRVNYIFDPHGLPTSRVLPIADLVVERGEGGLTVATRDGGARFEIIDFFQFVMIMQAIQAFRVLPGRTYTPRVTIDRLVVARESWAFPAGGLDFAQAPAGMERFLAARRWAGRSNLPRFLYVKTALERKPFYVDLESPVLIEILAKAVRSAAKEDPQSPINLSEMLPALDQLWMPDAAGNRYTCELRVVALDLGDAIGPGDD
jgi:hypothetical protein